MNESEIKAALAYLKEQFLKPGDEFDVRKQANAVVALCFRNTKLEDFHGKGYISDSEMKNLIIDSCARVEYLMNSKRFKSMPSSEIFYLTLEIPYKTHITRNLRKSMREALKKQAEERLSFVQSLKSDEPLRYEITLLGVWSMYAQHYDEDIKFDGQFLSCDPNDVAVGEPTDK